MKSWTYFRIILLSILLGACSRNPLGEDLKQPLLNFNFILSQSCTTTFNQDVPFTCQILSNQSLPNLVWSLSPATTCTWASINSATGVVTGTPNDNQVGTCNIVVSATSPQHVANPFTFPVVVQNVAPTLTITDAANINEGAALAVIRDDTSVQASEEGFGTYSFDHTNTTTPRCFDNASALTIDANTGAVSYAPAANYNGTCHIRVMFDDGNGVANSTVTSEFSITVLPINNAPVLAAIANQTTNEDIPLILNFTITDVDSVLNCATSVSATSSNTSLMPVANIVFGGTAPNCTATFTPVLNASGATNISFTVTDGFLTDTKNFVLTVNAVNDPPVLVPIANQLGVEDTPLIFNINISDVDSVLACNSTYLSATSSNGAMLPASNISYSGLPPTCTVTMIPVADANGTSNILMSLTDGFNVVSQSFSVTFSPVNDAPVMSTIANQSTAEDTPIVVPFTITDIDSVLNCSTAVSVNSSNLSVVTAAGVVFGGAAPNCTATITPVLNASGATNISFTVTDGFLTDTKSFALTVSSVNDAPVINSIATQTVFEDSGPTVINFTITDVDSTLNCATSMSASSSNVALVPIANIVFGGVAPNCTATVTSIADANGFSNLTFTVTDGLLTGVTTFAFNVTAVNDAPIMSAITNQTSNEDGFVVVNFTINDIDSALNCATSMSASSSNTTLLPVANVVFGGTAPNCTATLTPAADANGVTNLTFTVNDGGSPNLTDTKNFTYTVNAVNDAPIISAISNQTTTQDTPLVVNFTITDVDNTLNCATSMSASSSNTALLPVANIVFGGTAPNCTATLSPAFLQNGVTTVGLTVSDGSLTDVQNFTLTVSAFNYPPVISAISNQTTNEDVLKVVNFTITDVDNTLNCATSMSASSSNTTLLPVANVVFGGTAPNCTATLSPALNANGTSNLVFTVTDGTNNVTSSFSFTVTAVNDAPIISAISNQTTLEESPITINFTITDVDNTLNCVTSMSASSTNFVSFPVSNIVFGGTAPNCTATITPVADTNGSSTFVFTVSDGASTATSTFDITIIPVNDAPIMGAISNQTTAQDTPIVISFSITDVDNTLNCATSVTATSSNLTLVPVSNIVFGGSAPTCTATVTPAALQSGVTNLTFTVNDGGTPNLQDAKTFSLTVTGVNYPPVISAISNQTTNEDTPLVVNFTITDVDNTLNCATSMSASSSNTTLLPVANVVFGGTAPNCTATLSPALNANGTSNLVFTVTDGSNNVTSGFSFTVTPVNDAPIISAITNQATSEDTPLVVNFTITDVDNTLNCATSMSASSSNTALLPVANIVFGGTAPNCTATLSPALNANGASNLVFTVTDGAATATSNFSFTVTAVNDAPIISAITNQTTSEDTPLVVNFTITDVDNTLNCATSMSASSSNTTLLPVANVVFGGTAPNCTATLTSVADANGASNLVFTVTDGAATATSNFSFTVTPVNDAPIISAITNQTTSEDTPLVVNFTITDVDNTLNCATSMSASSSNTTLLPVANVVFGGTAPNCTATLSPALNANGTSNLVFTVTDGAATATSNFSFTVTAVNDAPIISAVSNQTTLQDTPLVVNFTITDVDNTLNCATSMSASSSNTTLLPVANIVFGGTAPNCTATLSPANLQNGSTNLVFTVTDGTLSTTSSFSLTVTAVNYPPVISAISNQTTNEDTPLVVNFTITDVDNTLNCATSMSASSSNTTLLPVANVVFGGTAPNCTATLSPALNANGASNLVFTVTDGTNNVTSSFSLTVTAVNDAPVISAIANQTTSEDTPLVVNFTITDVDNTLNCATSMSASSSNTALLPVANVVFGGTAPNCTATLSPALNANGASNLVFTVTDGSIAATSNFSFTVTPVNDAPVLSAITNQTTNEDTPISVNFTITDIDSVLLCTSTNLAVTSSNTALVPNANVVWSGTAPNCTATITPVADANGTTNLTFTVNDNGTPNLQDSKTFTLTVTAVNDAPIISAVSNQTTNEDTLLVVNFTITDVDNTLNCVTSMTANDSNTTLLPVANIVFSGTAPNCMATLTPALNQNGLENVTFRVTDALGAFQDQTFSLTVVAVDDPPVISTITSQSTNEDTPVVVNFTITDVDSTLSCSTSMSATSTNTSIVAVSGIVFSGTAPNCTATITPIANANGNLNLTFTVTDGTTPISTSFALSVVPVNNAPVMSTIATQTTLEDTPLVVNFAITDIDNTLLCSSSNLAVTSTNTALVPIANVVWSGTVPNCSATITPAANANGATSLTFTVNDNGSPNLQDAKTFTLNVTAVDDPPVIDPIADQVTNEDTPLVVNFTISDIDSTLACNTSMSATTTDSTIVTVGGVVFSGTVPNCIATISPVANANGNLNLTFTVTDGTTPVSTSFALTVNPVNDPPTLAAISNQTMNEGGTLVINYTINDVDNTLDCASSMIIASSNSTLLPAPSAGNYAGNFVLAGTAPNCTMTVTPMPGKFGSSNITFFVSDGVNLASRAFKITVTQYNQAPVISAIASQTTNENTASSAIAFTITDVDTTIACNSTYLSMTSSNTTVIPTANVVWSGTAPNCTAVITPATNQFGTSNIGFVVNDHSAVAPTNLTATSSFLMTVSFVNHAPTITTIYDQTIYEGRPDTVSFVIDDVDGALACNSTYLSATSSNTALLPVANIVFGGSYPNCTATISLASGQAGTSNVAISVTDTIASNSTSFVVTGYKINSVTLSPLTPIVPKSSNFSFTLTATYSDASTKNITTSSTWTTSNTSISSFPSAGVLNNTYSGSTTATTTVTGTYGAFSANTVATINPATVTSLIVNPTSANMNVGNTLQIHCYGLTSDNGLIDLTQSCSWSTANATIVTVDNNMDKGLVTGVNLGSATNITATYSSFNASAAITVDNNTPAQSDNGTGLTAQYYTGGSPYLQTLVNTRVDAVVNFNWATGNNPAGSADSFSVRWTGYVKAPTTGTYTFYTQSDDGVRMWVNGTQIINNWTAHSSTENSGTIALTAGTKYAVTLEFFEATGSAQIELRYSGPSVSKQIIPQSQLYP